MLERGLTTGTSPGCFEPGRILTRAEAAAFLHRLAGEPVPQSSPPFDDVSAAWAVDAVAWMAGEGITTGVGRGRFASNDPVTRGQFAAFLYRYEDPSPSVPHGFTDVAAPWQQEVVSWLSAAGITTGTGHGQYSPDRYVIRGQLATFLHRHAGRPELLPAEETIRCQRDLVVHAVGDVNFDPGHGPNPQHDRVEGSPGAGFSVA